MLRASSTTIRPRTVHSQVQVHQIAEEEAINLVQEEIVTEDHPQVLPGHDNREQQVDQKAAGEMVQVLAQEAILRLVLIHVFHWKMSRFTGHVQLSVVKDARNRTFS